MYIVKLSCCGISNCKRNPQIVSGIRKLLVESAFCLRIPLIFADSIYILRTSLKFCGTYLKLRNPEQLAVFACCGIRSKTNVPTNLTLQVLVRGAHETFVSGIHLHFRTYKNFFSEIQEHTDTNCAPI